MEATLLEKAARMAAVAHQGQMRKDGPYPYIEHLIAVALLLSKHGFSDVIIAAGLAHDMVEDTPVTAEEVRRELGDEVADIVASVTNDPTLPWMEKKKKYIESVRAGSDGAKAVATADKIANARSLIVAYAALGDGVWSYFNSGRENKEWFEGAMLQMLRETWEHPLVDEYAKLVGEMKALA
jgi:(p)ppGpp synthase/HD superfamily hydrolase